MNTLKLDRGILAANYYVLITDITMKGRNKTTLKSIRSTLKVLPYYSCSENLEENHSQFNNSVSTTCKTKKELDKLTRLYDLDLLSLNTTLDHNLNPDDYCSKRITSRYFSPHSFKEIKRSCQKMRLSLAFLFFITT